MALALDPQTLKAGDVVIFGGRLERTVSYTTDDIVVFTDSHIFTRFEEAFWQIAELKKPSLPNVLGGNLFTINRFENYSPIDHANIPPFLLLTMLKRSVKELEAAGVKEA